jgi:hypothetical protein
VGVGLGFGEGFGVGFGLGLGALGAGCAEWLVFGALEDALADGLGAEPFPSPEDDAVGLGLADGDGLGRLVRFFLAVRRSVDADLDADGVG